MQNKFVLRVSVVFIILFLFYCSTFAEEELSATCCQDTNKCSKTPIGMLKKETFIKSPLFLTMNALVAVETGIFSLCENTVMPAECTKLLTLFLAQRKFLKGECEHFEGEVKKTCVSLKKKDCSLLSGKYKNLCQGILERKSNLVQEAAPLFSGEEIEQEMEQVAPGASSIEGLIEEGRIIDVKDTADFLIRYAAFLGEEKIEKADKNVFLNVLFAILTEIRNKKYYSQEILEKYLDSVAEDFALSSCATTLKDCNSCGQIKTAEIKEECLGGCKEFTNE